MKIEWASRFVQPTSIKLQLIFALLETSEMNITTNITTKQEGPRPWCKWSELFWGHKDELSKMVTSFNICVIGKLFKSCYYI